MEEDMLGDRFTFLYNGKSGLRLVKIFDYPADGYVCSGDLRIDNAAISYDGLVWEFYPITPEELVFNMDC